MGHEISQFDIPDRQLLAINARPGAGMGSDIGEAKITRTIFGRTKIRVIRERDKKLRAWLLTALAVMALAVAAWQGWVALQKSELLAPPLPLSERIKVSPPVFQPEDAAPSDTPPSARSKQKTLTETVLDSMTTRRPPPPPQPIDLKAPEPTAAKPVKAQPLITSRQQTAPPATNNTPSKQTVMQQPAKLPAPIQPAAPAVVTPRATQPAAPAVAAPPMTQPVQPEATRPAAAAPPPAPLIKEDTSPATNTQPAEPVNAQH